MADKAQTTDVALSADTPAAVPPPAPRRSPGHRGADMRDTVAEMAARAHEISLEAGSKMASAMKDVINAAAGLAGFAVESARDLVQYMVRRGQMSQEEADKLLRDAEEAYAKRRPAAAATPPSPAVPSTNGDAPSASRVEPRAIGVRAEPGLADAPRKRTDSAREATAAPATKKTATKAAVKAPAAKAPGRPTAKSATKAAAKAPARASAKAPTTKSAAKAPAAKKGGKKK